MEDASGSGRVDQTIEFGEFVGIRVRPHDDFNRKGNAHGELWGSIGSSPYLSS